MRQLSFVIAGLDPAIHHADMNHRMPNFLDEDNFLTDGLPGQVPRPGRPEAGPGCPPMT
jgi:hypothetical protein